jgi:hypothetical protein
MWPYGIVVPAPAYDRGSAQAVEDLAIQQLIAQARGKRFPIPVLL